MNNTTALLIEHHFKELYNKAKSYAYKQGHDSPEDAASEAIAIALSKAEKFEGDISNLISYILYITHYRVKEFHRQNYKKKNNEFSVDFQESQIHEKLSLCDEYFKYQYLVNIKNMTSSLKTYESQAIIGKYVYDYTDFEISQITNLSPNTIRVRRSTGISKIRKTLERSAS